MVARCAGEWRAFDDALYLEEGHAVSMLEGAVAVSSFDMRESGMDLAPVSEVVTRDVQVEVMSQYSAENSRPAEDQWVFQYTVRITNLGTETVRLISRHWIITDALEHVQEVRGPGVVGAQPVLAPGESFQYSSWCPLTTPMGRMHGTYQMVDSQGGKFDIEIAPFGLRARYTVH
jgi:ApaG protein